MSNDSTPHRFVLSDFLAKDSVEIEVMHPYQGPTGWFMTVRGKASVDYIKARAELVENSAKVGRAALQKTAHYERLETSLLVASILGWRGLHDDTGAEIPYSPAKAKELLEHPGLFWLREFLDGKLQDSASFF
jgi:hypothetical protein